MAIQTSPETILLKAKNLQGQVNEFILGAAAYPGHVVRPDPANAGEVIKNALTTGADIPVIILTEEYLAGDKTIDTAYAADDRVRPYHCIPGDEVYVRIPAAAAAIVEGDRMQLDATGCMIKLASGTQKATALEAVDNSGGGSEAFIQVRIS